MTGSEIQNGGLKGSDDSEMKEMRAKRKVARSKREKGEKKKGKLSKGKEKGKEKENEGGVESDNEAAEGTELKKSSEEHHHHHHHHKKRKEKKHKHKEKEEEEEKVEEERKEEDEDQSSGDEEHEEEENSKKKPKKSRTKKTKEGKGKEKEKNEEGEDESDDSQTETGSKIDRDSDSEGEEDAGSLNPPPEPKSMSIEDFMSIATANIAVTKTTPEEEEPKSKKKEKRTKKKEKEEQPEPAAAEEPAVLEVPDEDQNKKHVQMEVLAWTGEETPSPVPKRRSKTILTLTTPKEKPGSNDRVLTDRGGRHGKEKVVIPVMDKKVGDQRIKELDGILVGSLATLTENTPWGQEHGFVHDKSSYTSSKCGLCRALIKPTGAFRCSKCSQIFHEECLETMKYVQCLEGKRPSLWSSRRSFVGEFTADHKRIVPTIDYASQIKTKRKLANVALFNDSILILYSGGGKMKVVEMIRWECQERETSVTVNSLSEDTISLVSPLTEIKHQMRFKSQREKEAWFAKINSTIASHDNPEEGDETMSMTQPRSQMSQSSMRSFTSIEVKNPDYVFEVTTVVPLAEGSSKSKMNFAYHIYVTKKRKKWAILKRYEDIEELDYNLKHLYPSRKQTCRLPDKKLYSSNDTSLTTRRMKLLEGYLNSLNHLIGVWRIGFVKEFFRPLEGDDENLSLSDTDTEDEVEDGDCEVEEMREGSLPSEWAPALKLFNSSAKEGIRYLENEGLIQKGDPEDIAKFLHLAEGLSKDIVGEYLGKRENDATLKAYTARLNFSNMSIDEALRKFLNGFRLCGEAQAVDRCMEAFATQYCLFNPGEFSKTDTAYILAFALIMLNTDAHSPEVKNKMSLKAFCSNLLPVDSSLSEEYLKFLYNNITKNEIKLKDEIEGWLEKLGPRMRVWKKRWFVLVNGCLYYYKDKSEVRESKWLGFFPLENLAVRQMSDLVLEIFIPAQIAHTDQTTKTIVGEYIKTCKQTKGKGVKTGRHKNFVMKATTEAELQRWIMAIQSNLKETPLMDYIRKQAEKQMALGMAQNGGDVALPSRSRGASLRSMAVPGETLKARSSSSS